MANTKNSTSKNATRCSSKKSNGAQASSNANKTTGKTASRTQSKKTQNVK